ncbi:Transposase for insertion sequence element IS406 [Bienertia sinuspersici]
MLHGSMQEHYLKVGSLDSKVILVTDDEENPLVFKRIFICFDGAAKGWREGCRKVLCIDACFLKTFLGGKLLVAVGRYGNDQMFLVAWEVVEGENNDSWEWFLNEVKICLQLNDGAGTAIISDEHLLIIAAVRKVLPQAEHRHCARHIYLFWRAVKACNEADYNEALEDMRKVNPSCVEAFVSYNPCLICRHLMNTETKVDVVVKNLAETFNGYIISARTKHLLHIVEEIRTTLMQRLALKKADI